MLVLGRMMRRIAGLALDRKSQICIDRVGAICLSWLCLFAHACWAEQTEPAARGLVDQAIAAYSSAMEQTDRNVRLQSFAQAEQLFRQSLASQDTEHDSGVMAGNAALWVNLGNAALQAERLGPAIVAYRRALAMEPTLLQAQQNLRFARSALPDSFQQAATSGLIETLFFWNTIYTKPTVRGIAGLLFLFGSLLLACGIARKQAVLRNLAWIPLLGWAILLGSTMTRHDKAMQDAVVVASELILYSADSENSPPRLSTPLTSGVELKVLRERERWTEVELTGSRTGWVRSSGIEKVAFVP